MMKEELYNKIDKFCNETDWSKYPTYEHALEEFIRGIVAEETLELEKENAELKADNAEWEKASDKWKSLFYSTNNDLIKAKEIIKDLLSYSVKLDSCLYTTEYEASRQKAIDFLGGKK